MEFEKPWKRMEKALHPKKKGLFGTQYLVSRGVIGLYIFENAPERNVMVYLKRYDHMINYFLKDY